MDRSAHAARGDFIEAVIKAASLDGARGFVFDSPPGARHPRNLPFSWAGGSVIFGWEPEKVLEIREPPPGAPLDRLRGFLQNLETAGAIAVGFISYDLGGHLEPAALSHRPADPMPLLCFAIYGKYYEYEAESGRLSVCEGGVRRPAGRGARREILRRAAGAEPQRSGGYFGEPVSDFTRESYMRAVAKARDYIFAGDIFEVNISQRFTAAFSGPAWDLYLRLRRHNPAPYAAFLSLEGAALLSSSPELFLAVENDHVITRPIKGTIARPPRPADDEAAARTLASSEKDNAELAMIIDLERNDLGRVCRYGSVRVRERARVETFTKVHHLVSTVQGRLVPSAGLPELLRAAFPGGSITGAPKVRAMQIIDELEPHRRGIYTGSIGYVLPGGSAQFNIAIRTMVCRGHTVWLQVGGAVTADSDPAAEYEETLAKARGMMAALAGGRPAVPEAKVEKA